MLRIIALGSAVAAVFAAEDASVTLHVKDKCAKGKKDVTVSAPSKKCLAFPGEDIWWSVDCSGKKDSFSFFADKDCTKPLTKAVTFKGHTCISLADAYGAASDSSSSSVTGYGDSSSSSSGGHKKPAPKKEEVKVKYEKPVEKKSAKKSENVEKKYTAKCQLFETKKITQVHFAEAQTTNVRYETRKVTPLYKSISVKCPAPAPAPKEDTSSSSSQD